MMRESFPSARTAVSSRVGDRLCAGAASRNASRSQSPFAGSAPRVVSSAFAAEEKLLLTGLPAAANEISRWVYGPRVGRNGHVAWERKHHYSVPFARVPVDEQGLDAALAVFQLSRRHSAGRGRGDMLALRWQAR
ncbi:hypothetical protein [Arthrobacter sp. StoSoilA2]|uniref:hypothetical protein n=1 Tax=Arthrobacter sp. StoSoilA2 TaxID=2830990 RepID=UPI001CC607E4|nr:hypothetical protein [Arthrobacter sp. StoSoilA2]